LFALLDADVVLSGQSARSLRSQHKVAVRCAAVQIEIRDPAIVTWFALRKLRPVLLS